MLAAVSTAGTSYHGIPRLDFYFDDPNKLACLLCFLVLCFLGMALRVRRPVFALPLHALALLSGWGLARTFSRGGLVACLAGVCVLLLATGLRPSSRKKLAALAATLVLFAGLAVGTGSAGRLLRSSPSRDGSVANRLMYWRAVPRMVADAPSGWGLGEAGCAFMSWYQPLGRGESVRTLVGSHCTWLVEFGRAGRALYCSAWLFVLGLCACHLRRRGDPLPLAVWTAFLLASGFASVAEAGELWVLPAVLLLPPVRTFGGGKCPRIRVVLLAALGGALASAGLELAGRWQRAAGTPPVRALDGGRRIVYGAGEPSAWIVRDRAVMGGGAYGHALRRWCARTPGAFGVARARTDVPRSAEHLVLCGEQAAAPDLSDFPNLRTLRVLLPVAGAKTAVPPGVAVKTFYGEFAANCPWEPAPGEVVLEGVKDVLVDWPRVAFGSLDAQ